jgi:hypothetical protein
VNRSVRRPSSERGSGFGLLELATALALLVIVLGLCVSLARYVRATSAEQITRQTLRQLSEALAGNMGSTAVPEIDDAPLPGAAEAAWAVYAMRSNEIVRRLAGVDEVVADAWGNPIGFLAFERVEIGMAPHDRPFCYSAGPDGRHLTQDDNLYSYEQLLPFPQTQPAGGGHGE